MGSTEQRGAALALAVGGLLSVAGSQAGAVTIVDLPIGPGWYTGSELVVTRASSNVQGDFDGQADTNDRIDRINFSTATKFTRDETNAVQSGVFYGGAAVAQLDSTVTTAFNDNSLRDGGGTANDFYSFGYRYNAGTTARTAAAGLWLKQDFLNGASAQTVDLTGGTISARLNAPAGGRPTMDARWLVMVGGQTYISQANMGAFGSTVVVKTIDLAATPTDWAPIDLASSTDSLSTGMFSAPGAYGPLSLTNIEGIGFYVNNSPAAPADLRVWLSGFSATAAVPEPATMGVLATSGALMLVRRRKVG